MDPVESTALLYWTGTMVQGMPRYCMYICPAPPLASFFPRAVSDFSSSGGDALPLEAGPEYDDCISISITRGEANMGQLQEQSQDTTL